MKKVSILGMLLVSTLLASCSKDEPSQEINSSNSETVESTLSQDSIFEDGVLESENFTLKVTNSQTIKSPYYEEFGLFVTFDLTNNSEEAIIPDEILMNHIIMKQKNDTSVVELDNYYDFENSFGDDIDTYNQQVEKYNSMSDELLPGKKVEIYGAYTLDNLDHSVEMMVLVDGEEFNGYEIEISDVTSTVENHSSDSNTEITNSVGSQPSSSQNEKVDTDTIAQKDYWEAVEYGLPEEEIAYYLSHKWYGDPATYDGVSYKDLNDYLSRRQEFPDTSASEEDFTTKYQQAINEGATEYQAQTYSDGWVENWRDAPAEIPSDVEYLDSLTDEELDTLFETPKDDPSLNE